MLLWRIKDLSIEECEIFVPISSTDVTVDEFVSHVWVLLEDRKQERELYSDKVLQRQWNGNSIRIVQNIIPSQKPAPYQPLPPYDYFVGFPLTKVYQERPTPPNRSMRVFFRQHRIQAHYLFF